MYILNISLTHNMMMHQPFKRILIHQKCVKNAYSRIFATKTYARLFQQGFDRLKNAFHAHKHGRCACKFFINLACIFFRLTGSPMPCVWHYIINCVLPRNYFIMVVLNCTSNHLYTYIVSMFDISNSMWKLSNLKVCWIYCSLFRICNSIFGLINNSVSDPDPDPPGCV